MEKLRKKKRGREAGAIMLEGIIVMVIVMFVLVWILGIGFIYYQRYMTTIVTNDAAVKIASTYNNPTSDIIMGYVTTEDVSSRDLYRNFTNSGLQDVNEERAASYVKYILDKTNFSNVVKDVDVELSLIRDSSVRKHIQLTVTCTYDTPFGEALELFGMESRNTYAVTSSSDCTDILDYYSTVHAAKALSSGAYTEGMGIVDSAVKLLNSLVRMWNQVSKPDN